MQFTIWCKSKGDVNANAWPEKYNKAIDDPERWAIDTIKAYNRLCMQGECKRVLVKVVVEANTKLLRINHSWHKTNLVTLPDLTDRYVCTVCGAKGTRYGFGQITANNKSQIQCKDTNESRKETDIFDNQVFDSYLCSKEKRVVAIIANHQTYVRKVRKVGKQ